MLENENDDLHEQLALGDDRIDAVELEAENLRGQLGSTKEELSQQEADIRTKSRELGNLKVCGTAPICGILLTFLGGIEVDDQCYHRLCEIAYGEVVPRTGVSDTETRARASPSTSFAPTNHIGREVSSGAFS